MPGTSASATPRYAGVDTLRGISIVTVVLLHAWLRLILNGRSLNPLLPRWALHLIFKNPLDAVPVFFGISGFLITYTCIRRFGSLRHVSVSAFYRIRFARIAPLLLLILVLLSAMHLLHFPNFRISSTHGTLPRALLSALTFHLNWYEAVHGYLPPAWDVLWSLSVEEMFYLFFPLLCYALLRWRGGQSIFFAILISLIAMGPFARTVWTANNDIWAEKSYLGGTDCIALGCLTAMLIGWCERRNKKPSDRTLLAIVWAGIIVMALLVWPQNMAWRKPLGANGTWDSLMILAVCAILFGTVLRNRPGRGWSVPLRWFGRHSYEVYMTHEFVIIVITDLCLRYGTKGGHTLLLWAASMLILSAPLGWLIARYFSEPMNRRLRGARPPQPANHS